MYNRTIVNKREYKGRLLSFSPSFGTPSELNTGYASIAWWVYERPCKADCGSIAEPLGLVIKWGATFHFCQLTGWRITELEGRVPVFGEVSKSFYSTRTKAAQAMVEERIEDPRDPLFERFKKEI